MDNPLERQEFDRGWLIGILDGEGCFTLNAKGDWKNRAYFPVIQITNTNLLIIQKAKRIIEKIPVGVYLESKVPSNGNKTYYRLNIQGMKRVNTFLKWSIPFMECRVEQAKTLFAFTESRLLNERKPTTEEETQLVLKLRTLNS